MAKIAAELLREAADAIILPFDVEAYVSKIEEAYESFNSKYSDKLSQQNITLVYLKKSIDAFANATQKFNHRLHEIDIEK